MTIGWIDFSGTDRKKVYTVLQNLREKEVVDELGIAPVRDGFADLLFPGTSTLHTRAKYFLIVPYALKELEKAVLQGKKTKKKDILEKLGDIEKECCRRFLEYDSEQSGIIGKRAMSLGGWIKRTPADNYFAGIRQYGILTKDISLNEFIESLLYQQKEKIELKALSNYQGKEEDEAEEDDKDTTYSSYNKSLLNIPCYREGWIDNLKIELTHEEGEFLKSQIISSCEGSLLSFILKNGINVDKYTFDTLGDISSDLPQDLKEYYILALKFSNFWKIPQTIYNILISDGRNEKANETFDEIQQKIPEYSQIDIDEILRLLKLDYSSSLKTFLSKSKFLIQRRDFDGFKKEILRREANLKGERAKTKRKGEFEDNSWYGGFGLSYRFGNTKMIINDILEAGSR